MSTIIISKFYKVSLTIIFFLFVNQANAQDTLLITRQQANQSFIEKNFTLLAASFNVKAEEAKIIQAKSYPNPIVTAELNAYDPENAIPFHNGKNGQKVFQFEQLIILGGKRKSEVEMAKTNAEIASLEFQQTLLQLKYKLNSSLFAIGLQQLLIQRYNEQLILLNTLLESYETQAQKGNIPLKEVVRLKGAYLMLNNDRAAILKEYYATLTVLQTLLQCDAVIKFDTNDADIESYIKTNNYLELENIAFESKPELLIIKNNKTLAEQYLSYQKKIAIPDLNLYSAYDQQGGAFRNQISAGISMPLPLWNRNRGNIKAARFQIKAAEYNLLSYETELKNNLKNAFLMYTQAVQEYTKAKTLYNNDFEITIKGMTENFSKRNVSIIEFIDFFESYNEVQTELMRTKTNLVNTGEQINLLIGKEIY